MAFRKRRHCRGNKFNAVAGNLPRTCIKSKSDKILPHSQPYDVTKADGLWAIGITNLTVGAKHFCKVLPRKRSLTYSKIILTDKKFGQ